MEENNHIIKLYDLNHELSNIKDLVIDKRAILSFEVRGVVLINEELFNLSIEKDGIIIRNSENIKIENDNRFELKDDSILSRTSNNPFIAKLKNSFGVPIAEGTFYRYRKNPTKIRKWEPDSHKNYLNNSGGHANDNEDYGNEDEDDEDENDEDEDEDDEDENGENDDKDEDDIDDVNFETFDSFLMTFDDQTKDFKLLEKRKISKIYNRAVKILKEEFKINKIAHFKLNLDKNKNQNKDVLNKLLKDKIRVKLDDNREEFYCYIGSSNSGRRESNFWAIEKENFKKLNLKKFLNYFGNFSKFQTIQKFNKRYSLLYTTCKPIMVIKRTEYKIIDDFEKNTYCFTDGVGIIRKKTCEEISKSLNLDYTSYVFQIRMGGFKGVLTGFSDEVFDSYCDKDKKKNEVKILLRKSQEKFESHHFDLCVVSWATDVTVPASLNSEIIMILDGIHSDNKVRDYFLKIFEDHLNEMEKCFTDPKKALAKLFNSDIVNEFTHKYKMILLACRKNLIEELDPKQYKIICDILIEQNLYKIITKRNINIQLDKSAYFIGVIDETGELEEGEVYVSYYNSLQNIEYLDGINVAVCKMPCYSVTEIQKVRAKKVQKLSHLVNCVVFSKKGKRPLTNILSGGDLDGDLYFVTWNDHLTNFENSKKELIYPKDNSDNDNKIIIDIENKDDLHSKLINVYVDEVCDENKIGLWHYSLLCSYDESRKNMIEDKYLKCVIEINKCIDGIKSNRQIQWVSSPSWYISSKDLKCNSSSSLSEKIDELNELLRKKNIKDINEDSSLLANIISKAVDKFYVVERKRHQNQNGEFLTEKEIKILEKNGFIFDSSSRQIDREILKKIEEEYKSYCKNIIKMNNNNIESENGKSEKFKGIYERQLEKKVCSEKEKIKAKLANDFRNYVLNLRYFIRDNISDENLKKSVKSLDGIYFKSRVVSLYEVYRNDEINYQIPWMFYDVLCYLKNLCNDKLSEKVSNVIPNMIPFNLCAENTTIFSTSKLSKFDSIN